MNKKKPAKKLVAEYFKKCFLSVDGLWFVKVEEAFSFDTALELDVAVWKVLPKIEARTIKQLLSLGNGVENLRAAIEFKLAAEDYDYTIQPLASGGFKIHIGNCPWVNHITKAGRAHLLDRIAEAICPVEYETFAREFGHDIAMHHERKCCSPHCLCVYVFSTTSGNL
ncbi:MAG: DUF6125 family protein [Desulfobacterota bacterium]|nr:DUF6125 family protein [Thermodesulfobacteriota bacterium]